MQKEHLKIDCTNTPEKLHPQAEELALFLAEKLLALNEIEESNAILYKRVYGPMKEIRDKLRITTTALQVFQNAPGTVPPDHLEKLQKDAERYKKELEQGVRVNGVRYQNEQAVWDQYRQQYGQAAASFCTQKLLNKGYAQSFRTDSRGKPCGSYAFLKKPCELAVTMKTTKRAVIDVLDEDSFGKQMPWWLRFTLSNQDGWVLEKIQIRKNDQERWQPVGV